MEAWERPDIEDCPSATLSPGIDSVIHRLQISQYHTIDNSEASVRIVIGHADWLLCHDDPQYGIDSTLIAIEAKRSCELSCADHQMAGNVSSSWALAALSFELSNPSLAHHYGCEVFSIFLFTTPVRALSTVGEQAWLERNFRSLFFPG